VLGFVDQKFDIGGGTTARGGGGGQVADLIPLGRAFLTAQVYEELRLGFSLAALYGGGVDYDNNWAGRTWVTQANLAGLNLGPALAYPVTDWLSLGGAVSVTYFTFDYQLKAGTAVGAPTIELDNATDWAVSGTVSVLLEPREDTIVGFYYRTPVKATLSGEIDNPLPAKPKFDLDFNLAQGVNVGVFHQLTPELALLADADWSDWSEFDFQALKIGPVGSVGGIPRNFKDTWRIGVGAQYRVLEDWLLRGGFSYDSSPVDAKDRLPDTPASEQYRFSAGFQRQAADNIVLGMSYTFLWMANNEIDNVRLPGETVAGSPVVLDGKYDPSFLHFVGVSLGVNF